MPGRNPTDMRCPLQKTLPNCAIAVLTFMGLSYVYLLSPKAFMINPLEVSGKAQAGENVYIVNNENSGTTPLLMSMQDNSRSNVSISPAKINSAKARYEKEHTQSLKKRMPLNPHFSKASHNQMVKKRFLQRKRLSEEVCRKHAPGSQGSHVTEIAPYAYGQLKWCLVFKVASSFLLQLDINMSKKNEWNRFPWNVFPLSLYSPYHNQKRFMVVREPYTRMVSAYIDRLVTNPDKWDSLGERIVRKFRFHDSNHDKACGHDVTFSEFVKYVIHSQEMDTYYDGHFAPMSQTCDPCQKHFDFICHFETLKEDMTYVYKSANLTTDINYNLEPGLIKVKVKNQLKAKNQINRCKTTCQHLRTMWWAFQSRGLIARDLTFPLTQAQCDDKTWVDKFSDLCWKAHIRSHRRIDKHKEEWRAIVELFLQVPLEDRIRVRNLYAKDFELFGYESQPDDIFPELKQNR